VVKTLELVAWREVAAYAEYKYTAKEGQHLERERGEEGGLHAIEREGIRASLGLNGQVREAILDCSGNAGMVVVPGSVLVVVLVSVVEGITREGSGMAGRE
jgi:hypothetical protein